jgi:uncharacterized membrane protein YbhN (UPF0104 family)
LDFAQYTNKHAKELILRAVWFCEMEKRQKAAGRKQQAESGKQKAERPIRFGLPSSGYRRLTAFCLLLSAFCFLLSACCFYLTILPRAKYNSG